MASLHREPRGKSPYWYCAYRLADGRRAFKSTKQTDKKRASQICQAWEHAEELAAKGEATRDRLFAVVNQTLERMGHRPVEIPTVKQWLDRWTTGEEGAVSYRTLERYKQVAKDFLESLGTRSRIKLNALTTEDFTKFRDELLAEGRSPQTVNINVRKVLKRPFKIALEEGLLQRNPVAGVRQLRGTTAEKGTFTPEQIVKLVAAAEGDWKGLILAGYYTGARLSDLARLQWGNVDLAEKAITFTQRKTDTKVKVPIHPDLEEYLLERPSSDNPKAPLLPQLSDKPGSGKSGLSMSFKRIMERAGIAAGTIRERKGEAGRSVSALSFHSLRHSFNTALKRAGVSQEDRQKLTGHASAQMNTVYTHTELETLRSAIGSIARLPREANE